MKNIDLVFGYLINSPNGASSVVRLLLENDMIFKQNGINCNFHLRGNNATGRNNPNDTPGNAPRSLKNGLKQIIKSVLDSSTKLVPHLHSAYSIFNILLIPCRRIARSYTAMESPDSTDPLFFNDIFSCYYYLKYTKAKKRPILLVMHTNGETYNMLKLSYPDVKGSWVMKKLDEIERFTFSRVSDFGFVAKNAMEHFRELHPELKDARLHYVHNGLPVLKYAEPERNHSDKPLELCCVGSISYRKGQDIIIDALLKLTPEELGKIHVTFLGDGNTRAILEEKCEKARLTANVTFAGNRNDVNDFLLKSDIFILTSRDEGFPMAILEAERVGLPVISTDIAGIPEMIVNGETGLIIKPDCDDLYPIFKNIDAYDWKGMGKKSKQMFDNNFTIEKMIEGYCSILREM